MGRLKEVPGVFSQGETLEELEENIIDAYRLMMEEQPTETHLEVQTRGVLWTWREASGGQSLKSGTDAYYAETIYAEVR